MVSVALCSLSYSFLLFLFFFVGSSQNCSAHGDLDERIAMVSEEIKLASDSAYLYFKRGKLYFEHEEYKKSINDLDQATALGYSDQFCDLLYAKSYHKLENYKAGLKHIDRVLIQDESKVIAIKIKASILFDQKDYQQAALLHEKVIEHSIRTLPANYISASKSWELSATEIGYKKSIEIIEKGIKDLGPLFSFYHRIKELHLRNKAYEEALEVQKIIIKNSNRKETSFFQAAEICLLSKNKTQAKNYLAESLKALKKLPPRIRGNKSMKTLKHKIEITQKQLIEIQPR